MMHALAALFLAMQASGAVAVRFDPASPDVGPFPADALTVVDANQKTGRRVNLPLPDCQVQPSACIDIRAVNELDGFHAHPRIRVRFSGPVNPDTLRAGIWLHALENLTDEEYGLHREGEWIPINEVVYDAETNTAYAKPDTVLDQHRRYALVVFSAVRDGRGDAVVSDPAFEACLRSGSGYCAEVAEAVSQATRLALLGERVVAASVFTTMTVTSFLERARDLLGDTALSVQRARLPIIGIADLETIGVRFHVGGADGFRDFSFPASLAIGIGRIAFGSFRSPMFVTSQLTIPSTPTAIAVELPATSAEIAFHVLLPARAMPAGGFPVVIAGHGFGDSRFGMPSAIGPAMASAGLAVIAINAYGHGNGPEGMVVLTRRDGTQVELPLGGRGIDVNGDGAYDSAEGCLVVAPSALAARDCLRQTAIDLMQLVRAIRAGIDLDGDGAVDLDQHRIYYAGQSLGAMYGTLLAAVEPDIDAAALNVGGGTLVNIARTSPAYRQLAAALLGARTPSLLNQGVTFDDQFVLRYQPARVLSAPGAAALQEYFEMLEWLQAPGDAIFYAPHLKSSTLPGVPIKPVLFQMALGDQTVPNPANTALVRAANLRESTWIYRHDIARSVSRQLGGNPHAFLADVLSPAGLPIALAAQSQIAIFFASDGAEAPNPSTPLRPFFGGRDIFEIPEFLPEDFNFPQ